MVAIHFWYDPINPDFYENNVTIIHGPVDKYKVTTSRTFGYDLPNNLNLITALPLVAKQYGVK